MADPYVIKMPQLSDTMTEGVVVSWEKAIGDKIERGDIVATVETDKAIMDVEVFRDGYLSGPLSAVDSTIPVGEAMAYLVATADEVQQEGGSPVTTDSVPEASSAPAAETEAGVDAATGNAAVPEGASYTIAMQQLSDTMTEGVVVSWEKAVGDRIERGTVVATVETDKAIMDVEVFREGYLSGPLAPIDSTVPVGAAMAYLVESPDQVVDEEAAPVASGASAEALAPAAQASSAAAPASASTPVVSVAGASMAARPHGRGATPYARAIAGQRGIDLNGLRGTGPAGVIVAADVNTAPAVPAPAVAGFPQVDVPGNGRDMNKLEKAISDAMTSSLSMPTFRATTHIKLGDTDQGFQGPGCVRDRDYCQGLRSGDAAVPENELVLSAAGQAGRTHQR